jgi:hypothetical protein
MEQTAESVSVTAFSAVFFIKYPAEYSGRTFCRRSRRKKDGRGISGAGGGCPSPFCGEG